MTEPVGHGSGFEGFARDGRSRRDNSSEDDPVVTLHFEVFQFHSEFSGMIEHFLMPDLQ